MTTVSRGSYDHRIKAQVILTGNPDLFPELGIPRSTALSWIRRGMGDVVALDEGTEVEAALRARMSELEHRISMLTAVLRLMLAIVRVSGFRLELSRLPSAESKLIILYAIERARTVMPLSSALRVLRLSSARYHAWKQASETCGLDDRPSCPRSIPQRLTYEEVEVMGDMVQSKEHRHMSIRGLALYAQRVGRATWGRLIRDRGWRRPRLRVYPPKPKVGVRASVPNEAWHVDVTILKLLDGTKAYLHAVIDNYSRKVLAWTVAGHLDPMNTCRVLRDAARGLAASAATSVYMDSGIENLNGQVDEVVGTGPLERVLAQIDVSFSNSMIEAWWRSLKHQWLYLNHLDTPATVSRLVAFYVEQLNAVMPHAAFRGQTPNEMYSGTGDRVADELAARRRNALRRRLERNREVTCAACPRSQDDAAA